MAQKTPAQRTVPVVLVNAQTDPAHPVSLVRVSLGYLDGSVLVTEARDVTNPKGQAWLDVSEDAAQRGGLRIGVTGATDLVIYQPADGQLPALPATINVSMLPKGSPALLGPAQIEAMLHRALLQVSSLQKQVSGLKQQAQIQKPDLGVPIAEWALAMGFPPSQVDQQVQQWIQQIQRNSAQATSRAKALAEAALKHYANAAQLFDEAAKPNQRLHRIDRGTGGRCRRAPLDKARDQLKQLRLAIANRAPAHSNSISQFHQATQTLEDAEATADAEDKASDDKGIHELWLEALLRSPMPGARRVRSPLHDHKSTLLAKSADYFKSIAREYEGLGAGQEAAAAQNHLGSGACQPKVSAQAEERSLLRSIRQCRHSRRRCRYGPDAVLPREWAETHSDSEMLCSSRENALTQIRPLTYPTGLRAPTRIT